MPLDQDISYKVRIDDSDFQAKLTQMRASVDQMMGSSMGAMSGMPMGPMGMPMSQIGGYMGMMQQPGSAGMYNSMGLGGGFADFGLSVRPITYTPPAIAMQPHFGMFQMQQTFGQALVGSMQPYMFGGRVPEGITAQDYSAYSQKRVGDTVANFAATAANVGISAGMGFLGGELGAMAGGAMGGPLGALVGGVIGGTAGVAYGATPMGDITVQNFGMQNALAAGSFRFMQPGGRDSDPITGRGFSRSARFDIATSIQHMQNEDLRWGVNEYNQVLESGMQMDLFSGTRDADDFKQKFKGLVEAAKSISSTLHTSIKEASEAMRGMRDMGMESPSQMATFATRAAVYGDMSGRTPMEMVSIMQTGAEMFRGTGVSMGLGAEAMANNMSTVRSLLNSGAISRETIAQAGGEQSLAQQMTAQGLASAQTGYGRAFLMANYSDATHGFAPGAIEGLGGFSITSAANRLSGMTPGDLVKFQVHQREMLSQMSPQAMQGMSIGMTSAAARQLQAVDPKLSFEDAYLFVGENMEHKSHEVLQTELAMIKQNPEDRQKTANAAISRAMQGKVLEADRNRFNLGKRISNWFDRKYQAVADPINAFAVGAGEAAENFLSSAQSAILGGGYTRRSDYTSASATRGEAVLRGGGGGTGSITDVSMAIFKEGGEYEGSDSDISRKVAAAGGQVVEATAREKREEGMLRKQQYNGVEAQTFASKAEANKYLESHGGGMVIASDKAGHTTVLTSDAYKKSQAYAMNVYEVTEKEREEGQKKAHDVLTDTVKGRLLGLDAKKATEDSIAKAIYGPDAEFSKLSGVDRATVMDVAKSKEYGFTHAEESLKAKSRSTGEEARHQLNTVTNDRNKAESDARDILRGSSGVEHSWFDRVRHAVTGGGDFSDLSQEQLSALAAYKKSGGSEAAAGALLGKFKSRDEMNTAIAAASKLEGKALEDFYKNVDRADAKAAEARELSGGAATGELVKGAALSGVSKDEVKALSEVATQILESMKLVDSIHQQIMARQAGR